LLSLLKLLINIAYLNQIHKSGNKVRSFIQTFSCVAPSVGQTPLGDSV